MPELAGTLHMRDMKILGVESTDPRKTLPRDQPFDVRLTLDLTEMAVPDNTLLNYKASIYGKSRGSRSGQTIGEVEGTIKTADTVTINVEGTPPGRRHLSAGSHSCGCTARHESNCKAWYHSRNSRCDSGLLRLSKRKYPITNQTSRSA
jgi:hypothetical protein